MTIPASNTDHLFRLTGATTRDPAVERWQRAQQGELGALARLWFGRLRECGEDVTELIHDGCPTVCIQGVALAYVNAFTAHVSVGFFYGANLDDPAGLLDGSGKRMRHVKLRPESPVDPMALQQLIEDAYADLHRKLSGA
jgi:hypothetical protein